MAENATMGPDGGTGIINIDSGATLASAGTVNSSVAIAAGGVLASGMLSVAMKTPLPRLRVTPSMAT